MKAFSLWLLLFVSSDWRPILEGELSLYATTDLIDTENDPCCVPKKLCLS